VKSELGETLGLFAESREVREILGTARCSLRVDEMPTREGADCLASEGRRDLFDPGVGKVDSCNHGQNVDPDGLHSDLKDDPGDRQILECQIMERCSESRESLQDSFGILSLGPNPEIQILGRPDMPVNGQGMGTHEKELNAAGVELG
jgi:hypothetical protein